MAKKDFRYGGWNSYTLQCGTIMTLISLGNCTLQRVACGSGIMTVNSSSGSTLQCDMWLWDDMPLNSPKHPPYWISTSGFDFDHITAVNQSINQSEKDYSDHSNKSYCETTSSPSRMLVMNHNWSAMKQRPHPQSVAEISRHSVLSRDRIRQCETSSGSHHKDTDQCL